MIKFTRQDPGCCPSAEFRGRIYFIDERERRTSMAGWYLLSRQITQTYNIKAEDRTAAVKEAKKILYEMGYGPVNFYSTYAMPDIPSANLGPLLGGPTAYILREQKTTLRIVFPEHQELGPFDTYKDALQYSEDWINKQADFYDPQISLF